MGSNYLNSFYGKEQTHIFQGAKGVSVPKIDEVAAESEIHDFEKEMSSAKLTFDMDKMKSAQTFIHQNKADKAKQTMAETMQPKQLMELLNNSSSWTWYPNLMKLLSFSLIIPTSTASVETLFSRMNLVCTDL